jgi:hypothetical protein
MERETSYLRKFDIVTVLGIISLGYWVIDIFNNIFLLHEATGSLWFSSAGIGMTGLALLTRNGFLLSSLFCALFVVETGWNVGFFSHMLFHRSFMGFTDYLFNGTYTTKDFWITSYHIIMIPFIVTGLVKQKVVYKSAWIGALVFSSVLAMLTYFFAPSWETANCVHAFDNCRIVLFFIANMTNPLRTVVGVILATVLMYIPTNYLLLKALKGKG